MPAAPVSSWSPTTWARRAGSPTRSSSYIAGRVLEQTRRPPHFFAAPATSPEARAFLAGRSPSEPIGRIDPCCAACSWQSLLALTLPLAPSAAAGQVHHRRVDHLDRAVRPVRPSAADCSQDKTGIEVRVVARRHRPGAQQRAAAATPTWCSCTPSPPRRSSSPRASGVKRFDVMYNDFVIVGPKADPAGVAGTGRRRGADEDRRRRGALRLARRQQRHARGRAAALEGRRRRRQGRQRHLVSRDRLAAWAPTLNTAVGMNAYVLTDRGTWLSFKNRGDLDDRWSRATASCSTSTA